MLYNWIGEQSEQYPLTLEKRMKFIYVLICSRSSKQTFGSNLTQVFKLVLGAIFQPSL